MVTHADVVPDLGVAGVVVASGGIGTLSQDQVSAQKQSKGQQEETHELG